MGKSQGNVMWVPPNGRVLLNDLSLTADLLRLLPKVPISASTLRALLRVVASSLPFDEDFYAKTYPDLAYARQDGLIQDLREHYLDHGYLEGRLGASPELDEDFYLSNYPDVATAIENGEFASALEHYLHSGCSEGRFINSHDRDARNQWCDRISE